MSSMTVLLYIQRELFEINPDSIVRLGSVLLTDYQKTVYLFLFFLTFLPLLSVCLSVIQAYLHSMNIIHRDLNSHNCLVREVRTCLPVHFCICADIPLHIQHVFFKDLGQHTCHSLIHKQKRLLFTVAMGD